MRVLILTDAFTKPLRGQRMTALAKNLRNLGFDVTIANELLPGDDFKPEVEYLGVPFYPDKSRIKYLLLWVIDKLFWYKDYKFERTVEKNLKISSFDVIICSTFFEFPLRAARRLSKRYSLPLIVDLRDIIEQWGQASVLQHMPKSKIQDLFSDLYKSRCLKERKKALSVAEACTTVSPWHQSLLKKYNESCYLVYNGYDEEKYYPAHIPSEHFFLSYIGRLYDFTFHDPRALLNALRELRSEGMIPQARLIWHVEQEMITPTKELMAEYHLSKICSVEGFISRDDAALLLQKSSISILLTNHPGEGQAKGIMTTKFFEALGCEKPVLCTPTDEGCLSDTINYTNAGISSSEVNEIKNFIMEKYREWESHGFTMQNVCHKEEFSRSFQAKQFADIISTICR